MTRIEELHIIIDLIKKHDLPLSPILEYAIKEREDQYIKEESLNNVAAMVCEPQPEFSVYKEIEDYLKEFTCLSVGLSNGHKLPHKAILLISIMHLIEIGEVEENKIPLDKKISSAFISTWKNYFNDVKVPSVWTPFWYMKSESFWHFKSNGNDRLLEGLLNFAGHPSIGQMRSVIKYACFDDALFNYMQNKDNRRLLKEVLQKTYIKNVH
ncbi:MAG: hypothetical protein J6N21_01535 [Butyrivibrio sp.]|nr:hypothetical protein [Butyrivibrio sp.]